MNSQALLRNSLIHYATAAALVALAVAMRLWPLSELGARLAYLTFYPAVIIAAFFGGFGVGLMATVLSALTVIFWSPTGHPFINDRGDWLGMAVFLFNCIMMSAIAEAMIRARRRAQKAQQQAEAANRAKSVFLATMSHELRTPLNAILGFSNLMRANDATTASQRENLDIIIRSGKHLLSLINDVLDMAKIEAGRVTLSIDTCNIHEIASDIVTLLRPRAEEKGLQLQFKIDVSVPQLIQVDSEKLRQVLVNLVGNAVKFTHEGSVTLSMATQANGDALRLLIDVADTGVGIKKEDQTHVFEPFVQVGLTNTQKGTGLGLSIVREYIHLMSGNIHIESEPGKGTLFRVELPVQPAAKAATCSTEIKKRHVVGLQPGQADFRVLIAEDQEENWLLLQQMLEGVGFSVILAANGVEAIDAFQRFHPHFIWMDWRMPVMDGMEATRRIRALPGGKAVKIAAVTASAFDNQREEMLGAGLDDFVRKPYLPDEIFNCLAKHLGVRYRYAEEYAADTDVKLSAASFTALPLELRQQLSQCLLLGHVEQLADVLKRVEKINADLAKRLAHHLNKFNYLPVLNVLETLDQAERPAK